jgi:tyrosine-protein kinase Etk/Wzc
MEEVTPQVNTGDIEKTKSEEISSFNLKWLVSTILAIWPWLLGSVIISLIIGNLYLRYATPIFRSGAELMITDSKKGGASGDDVLKQLGLGGSNLNIENEIETLRSRTTMIKVVKNLHLNINYTIVGRFKTTNIFAHKPFEFILLDSANYYECKIDNLSMNGFRLVDGTKGINGKWGDTLSLNSTRVVLKRGFDISPPKLQYTVSVSPEEETAKNYMGAVDIGSPIKNATFILLSMQDNIPERSVAIINELMHIYMTNNVENRNRMTDSTLKFINKRLAEVYEELKNSEDKIEHYKQENNIADMNAQSVHLVNVNAVTNEKMQNAGMELQVIGAISDYLQNAPENQPITLPASLMSNAGLAEMLSKLNTIQYNIDNGLVSLTRENPIIQTLEKQKSKLKQDILSSLAASKQEVELKNKQIKGELGVIGGSIRKVPTVERHYLDFSRVQNIKQDLYIFLLKKGEETAIQKAATVPDANIIDAAITMGQVLPNHSRAMMMALLFGIALPFGIILIRKGLNIKIISRADITQVTNIPVIGEIGNSMDSEAIAVKKNSRTIISEQFRALRTNLQYLLTDKNDKIIMITSSMSGEGKSFIAVNLSIALAMSGKKVILLELDLRKPKISKTLGLDNSVGFSNFIIGKASYEDVIVPSGAEPNLFILPSGPVPPNPAELILLQQTEDLFKRLRAEFDFIIVDTSPVGLVTDAQLINKYADIALYIVRQGFTYKQQLSIPNELYYSGKIKRISFIVNDVVANRGFAYGYGYDEGYGYSYGYGYGYGYGASSGNGYYSEEKGKGIRDWFKRKK